MASAPLGLSHGNPTSKWLRCRQLPAIARWNPNSTRAPWWRSPTSAHLRQTSHSKNGPSNLVRQLPSTSDRAAQDGTGSEWEQHRSSSYLSGSYLRMPSSPSLSVSHISGGGCVNSCCPLIETGADGAWRIHIPLASILTTLGGLSLIVTHLGNLCCPLARTKV